MPELSPKKIQIELEKKKVRSHYWIYGSEQMKIRELSKRIQKAVLGDKPSALALETWDGTEGSTASLIDSAQNLSLGVEKKVLIIKNAHALKESETLIPLIENSLEPITQVCIFISKDFDKRKKVSKSLMKHAAVISCDAIPEQDKEAWIDYLANKKRVTLKQEIIIQLRSIDPWSLDIIDQELEKLSLSSDPNVLLGNIHSPGGVNQFLSDFFSRKLKPCLNHVHYFADQPDVAIPLMGLLSWNVRQLILMTTPSASESQLKPFLRKKFSYWSRLWSTQELINLQNALAKADFSLKQTFKIPLGIWTELVIKFCKP